MRRARDRSRWAWRNGELVVGMVGTVRPMGASRHVPPSAARLDAGQASRRTAVVGRSAIPCRNQIMRNELRTAGSAIFGHRWSGVTWVGPMAANPLSVLLTAFRRRLCMSSYV